MPMLMWRSTGTLVVTDCNEHALTKVALFDLTHPSP
jgi:hypothetical protein